MLQNGFGFQKEKRFRLLLDRAWDLIIHGPAHRGANGAAMPMDENDQDGHFFYNHPERGGYFAALARGSNPPTEGGVKKVSASRGREKRPACGKAQLKCRMTGEAH